MSELSGRRVLVTGACGFIGSHLVERLVADGARVRALVYYNSFGSNGWLDELHPEVKGAAEIVAGDVRDEAWVRTIVKDCEIVLHLAALVAIPYSYIAPAAYVQTNVLGTMNVLTGARDAGVERLVHTSSSEVYGTALRVPIDETHPLQGQSPYSATKIGADKLAESFHRSFGLPVVTLRPFNTYGPRQSTRAVIPTIITQILSGRSEVELGALTPTRDFTFVTDTVDAFVRAATTPGLEGLELNAGSGSEIAIGDLVHRIGRVMGAQVRAVSVDTRVRPPGSEVDRLLADATRFRTRTGWAPSVSLDDGLARVVAWMREKQRIAYDPARYHV